MSVVNAHLAEFHIPDLNYLEDIDTKYSSFSLSEFEYVNIKLARSRHVTASTLQRRLVLSVAYSHDDGAWDSRSLVLPLKFACLPLHTLCLITTVHSLSDSLGLRAANLVEQKV